MKDFEVLFNEWRNQRKYDNFVADGIIDTKFWSKSNKKILYILKEAYDNPGDGDICKYIKNEGINCFKSSIFRRVALWSYGFQHTTEKEIFPYKYFESFDKNDLFNTLRSVAWLNLKKHDEGNRISSDVAISSYTEKDSDFIKKEIELINPDIIICGNVFDILYKHIINKGLLSSKDRNPNWYYYEKIGNKEYLILDYYHPSNNYHNFMNYYGLMCSYQQAIKSKLNFV